MIWDLQGPYLLSDSEVQDVLTLTTENQLQSDSAGSKPDLTAALE